jgi:hypothetical protein
MTDPSTDTPPLRGRARFLVALALFGCVTLALFLLPRSAFEALRGPGSVVVLASIAAALVVCGRGLVAAARAFLRHAPPASRVTWLFVGGVAATALLTRLVLGDFWTPRYHVGLHLFSLRDLVSMDVFASNRPMGQSLLVALLHPLTNQAGLRDAFWVNAVLGALTIAPLLAAVTLTAGRWGPGLLVAGLLALDPLHVSLSRGTEFIVGGLFFATLAFAALLVHLRDESGDRKVIGVALAALFLSTQFRNEFIVLALPFALIGWSRRLPSEREAGPVALFVLAMLLPVSYQVLRFRFLGEWSVITADASYAPTLLGWLSGTTRSFDPGSLLDGLRRYGDSALALAPLLAATPLAVLSPATRRPALWLAGLYLFLYTLYAAARPGGAGRLDAAFPCLHVVTLALAGLGLSTARSKAELRSPRAAATALAQVLIVLATLPVFVAAWGTIRSPTVDQTPETCAREPDCRFFESRWLARTLGDLDPRCRILLDEGSLFRAYTGLALDRFQTLEDRMRGGRFDIGMCAYVYRDYRDEEEDRRAHYDPTPFAEVEAAAARSELRLEPVSEARISDQVVGLYLMTAAWYAPADAPGPPRDGDQDE